MGNPDSCEPIKQQFLTLEKQIQAIQTAPGYIQGPHDPHPGKPDPEALAEVKNLWKQVAAKIAQWNACELALPGHKPELNAKFSGKAKLTTSDNNAAGPFFEDISIGLLFHQFDHTTFDVQNFPPIVVPPFSTPAGNNTTTITLKGSAKGTFNPSSGVLILTISLHFHESNVFAGDSDITFSLSTENTHPAGSRLNAAGKITIAGTSIFQGGFLGGDTGTLEITGNISPQP